MTVSTQESYAANMKEALRVLLANNTNEEVLRQTQKMMKYNHFYDEEWGNLVSILGSAVNRLSLWGQVSESPNNTGKLSSSNSLILKAQVQNSMKLPTYVSLLCARSCARLGHMVNKMGQYRS